ncbi:calcium ion P-type ATPase [Aspergillus uvarum CBS 121591]|uniref:Calcium-transporting ATPase n=1 Tax=Aspergillus uvarum CBS 121591 TaxID=1448315 RepID=A0A319C3S7_9EURO|nr:calcium ion P-type ATPase [Aspergillus uvarum CBS 121591]PYH80616.1 calcium ion P-type ATPase [Aspergillus uvarum CBS 121591]
MAMPPSPQPSLSLTPPRDTPVHPRSNTLTSTHYRDICVRTSSRRSNGKDNTGDAADTLTSQPSGESNLERGNKKFAFSPDQLNKLLITKSFDAFGALGGLRGLEKGLRTDLRSGLSTEEVVVDSTAGFDEVVSPTLTSPPKSALLAPSRDHTVASATKRTQEQYTDRQRVFGTNKLPEKRLKSIWELVFIAYNDKVLILLSIAAFISLAVGIPQSVRGIGVEWVEGAAIIAAIFVVVIVGAANDWQKERQFATLNRKKKDRYVRVIRLGKTVEVSVYDILVGDVMLLEPGDIIPADGILIDGHGIKCDESSVTGESEHLRKTPGDKVDDAIEQNKDLEKMDPFILSGSKIEEGTGTFLVTATGVHTTYGRTMMSLQDECEITPLQVKLNLLADYIAKLGLTSGLILFVVLFIKFLIRLKEFQGGAEAKGQAFLQILIVAVTIVVVAVPEGLPLAVTLALAFATTRMINDNNLVRLLQACETMGNATTICSDKTGTLTENRMSVVAATIGTTARFGDQLSSDHAAIALDPLTLSASKFVSKLSSSIKTHLRQSIALNSTAFESDRDGKTIFIGSKTETALLSFAREQLGLGPVSEERANANIVHIFPFDSGRKCMAVVVRMKNGKYRILIKGAAEILLRQSTRIVQEAPNSLGEELLSEKKRNYLHAIITDYGSRSLRCIALVHRDFQEWPPHGALTDENANAGFEQIFKDMTMLGIFGIHDPVREGVSDAVRQCQHAGVFVRMVTGDNIITAKAIAQQCGIYTPGGIAIEGHEFRQLSHNRMNELIPRLQVIARSSPDDKKALVSQLKVLGETVAVTGDGTNDAQALKTADVGFAMGVTGTEVAKEASDIILMDDNFTSIVKAIAWGRTVNDAVKKFLQFQLTVNITAVALTFVSAVASRDENSVLSAVQLLWVNLIMDTFAALALATDPPSPYVLERKPEPKSAPLITLTMWKMITGQAIYQLAVTLTLNFVGHSIFSMWDSRCMQTVVFNTFVFMQIFNQYNCRRVDNHLNFMEGVLNNRWFIVIQILIISGQVMIIFLGGRVFSVQCLDQPSQWLVSVLLGAMALPLGFLIRLIPDQVISKVVRYLWHRKRDPELHASRQINDYGWVIASEGIRDHLAFMKKVRGGRLRHIINKHSQVFFPSRGSSRPSSSSLAPAVGDLAPASERTPLITDRGMSQSWSQV